MNIQEVILNRLYNQQIIGQRFKEVQELVSWMGAIQAQDYAGSLWAIGLRLPEVTDAVIEKAISDRQIIRTWPLRGTLHFVASQDLRWMLNLVGPGIISGSKMRLMRIGIDESVISRSRKILIQALQGGKTLTRKEIYRVLESNRISTDTQRGMQLLWRLALEGTICCGPRIGRQPTFVLLDEWVHLSKFPDRDEAIANLAMRYFRSHGPATVYDFAWWSGLTVTEAKNGLTSVRGKLLRETAGEQFYWLLEPIDHYDRNNTSIQLLPAFDEFLVAYKDRSICLDAGLMTQVLPGSGILNPVIIDAGVVTGTWKRTIHKKSVRIEIMPFEKMKRTQIDGLKNKMKQYAGFINREVKF
jgi:hypothetical protein